VKLALVTTPWNASSPVGEHARGLVPHLAEHCEIDVYVEAGREGDDYLGWTTRSATALLPRDYDHVLYELGNEAQHGFMAPLVRALGGCVALHGWELDELALAAYPALANGGWKGFALALREGGPREARRYRDLLHARERSSGVEPRTTGALAGLALNRSIVRFADSFLVRDVELQRRILEERNAATPIGVVEPGGSAEATCASYRARLERLPPPRTARKSLIWRRVLEGLRTKRG